MRIREIIAKQGITTRELAERLNISQSALNQHISGNPSLKVLTSIANALGVEIWELFKSPEDSGDYRCPHCGKPIEIEIKKGSE